MGFTWIHLNQVNVGTDAGIGCAPYQCWCISIRVGTCAAINTCLKCEKWQTKESSVAINTCLKCEKWHTKESSVQKKSGIQKKVVYKRKQCSKGKSPVWSSKEGSDAENKMCRRGGTTTLAREVHPSKTTFGSFGHPNSLVQKVRKVIWEGTGAHTLVPGML